MCSICCLGQFHYFRVNELQSDLNNLHHEGLEEMGEKEELLIGQHVSVSISV